MSHARLTCLYRVAQLAMLTAILFAPGEVLRVMMVVLLVAGEAFHRAYAAIEATRVRQEREQGGDDAIDRLIDVAASVRQARLLDQDPHRSSPQERHGADR